jgi:hypothetical protein
VAGAEQQKNSPDFNITSLNGVSYKESDVAPLRPFYGFSNDDNFSSDEHEAAPKRRAIGFVPVQQQSANKGRKDDLDTAGTFIIGPHSGRFFGSGVPSIWIPPYQPYRYNNYHHHRRPHYRRYRSRWQG